MKYLLILFLLISIPCFASNVLIYDVGTGELKQYLRSVHTQDYNTRPDALINPSIPQGVPYKYLKVVVGVVLEMSQTEKDAVDAAEAQAQEDALLARIDKYDVSNLDLLTALVKRINVRIPSNPITKAEIIQQIKDDLGL